ncbi:Transposase, partial [Dysosmobacter welbionis]
EEGPQQDPAAQKTVQHPPKRFHRCEGEAQDRHRSEIADGDPQLDDPADHQISAPDQQRQRGDLTDTPTDAAQEHLRKRDVRQRGHHHAVEGRGGCDHVCGAQVQGNGCPRGRETGHGRGKQQQQQGAGRQRGIENVLAQATEGSLHYNDG